MYFLLVLLAYVLVAILTPVGIAIAIIFHFRSMPHYWKRLAVSLDQLGNVSCQHLLNATMITKNGIKFGNEDKTVSSILGLNKSFGTLTWIGRKLCNLLNKVDENHVENAVLNEGVKINNN